MFYFGVGGPREVVVIVANAGSSRRARSILTAGLSLGLLLGAGTADAQTAEAPDPATRGPAATMAALQRAWLARDAEAYLVLWRFDGAGASARERAFLAEHWSGEESLLGVEAPLASTRRPGQVTASAQIFTVSEPRARVTEMIYTLDRGLEGWSVVDREVVGDIDGLVHLSLDPQAYRAAGMTVRLQDFELTWTRGAVFSAPKNVGPTVLVFVGEGTVRFRPRPETERTQLRHYSGRPELVETVRTAFVRIHTGDFHRVVSPARLDPDPAGARHLAAAQRAYREQVEESFVLDTGLPRSPWWLMPALGDALVAFHGRRGVLTYALSSTDHEGITLFDRRRRLQISLYPLPGRDTSYNEDDNVPADVLHHDLSVRFQPDRSYLSGEDTLRIRMRAATSTLRLRLDDSLRVESIRSKEGGDHLFFRVRHQNSLMVSLGRLSGRVGEITLTVRFSGSHRPQPVDREVLQVTGITLDPVEMEPEVALDPVLVYSNRTAWYPQGSEGDYATAVVQIDVPAGQMAVTGGTPAPPRTQDGRTVREYRQDLPAKYITVAVGRIVDAGGPDAPPNLRGYAVPRTRAQTPAILREAAEMVAFFEGIFGPCPYPALNVVVVEGNTPGGHSPPGMIVLSLRPPLLRTALRDDPANFWDVRGFFLAHEIAHQWWGQGVAGQNYHERWISEAMAQYAAALWVRHELGDTTFRMVMQRMARWALRHAALGPIHLGHRLGHLQADPQVYRAIVYDKGAWVLHMLHQLVGADAFARALTAVQRDHRFGKAGSEHLRAALEKESGLALEAYFREWVYGTALPELRVSHQTAEVAASFATAVTIAARHLPGPVPLEIAVVHAGGREVALVELPADGGTFTIETSARPRRVEVNAADGILARVIRGR